MMTEEKIIQFIADFYQFPIDKITLDTVITEIAPDSIILVEMLLQMQTDFNIVLHQSELESVKTVSDILILIQNKLI